MSNSTTEVKVFVGNFDEVKEQIRSNVIQQLDFELSDLSKIRVPNLSMEEAFKLYAELRGEVDKSKTLFLMSSGERFDLSRFGDEWLSEYEFRETIRPFLKEDLIFETGPQFVFDDEISINDDFHSLNCYLWATESLVARLPVSSEILDSLDNINFYADYDVLTGDIKLISTYYTLTENGEEYNTCSLSLNDNEKAVLISRMEEFCKMREGCSCLDFVNKNRTEEGLSPIEKESGLSLNERIENAEAKKTKQENNISDNKRNVEQQM